MINLKPQSTIMFLIREGDTVRESLKLSEMKFRLHLLLLFLINVNSKTLKFFSSHNFGPTLYGPKPQIKDYVKLVNDPKANLPNMFTICSSAPLPIWTLLLLKYISLKY